jgi:hypothetical protein
MLPIPRIHAITFYLLVTSFLTHDVCAAPGVAEKKPSPPSPIGQARPGPWGKLSYHEAYLEAPAELLEYYPLPSTTTCWSIGLNEMEEFTTVLEDAGVSAAARTALLDPSRIIRMNESISIFPSADFVLGLSPEARATIYVYLGKHLENEFIKNPVFFGRAGVAPWLKGANLSERIQSLVKQLAWKRGSAWVLSDLETLLGAAASNAEAKEIFRTCSRTRTLILDLTIDDPSSLASLTKYWTTHANQRVALPFLESLQEAAAQGPIHCDICHLFSPVARQMLYTYPNMSLARNGRFPDCHWTSLNFFNHAPRDYYLNTRLAADTVVNDYDKVSAPYAFGDVIFFLKDGGAIHSCVHIADDIVFTKNGDNAVNPWMLAHLEEVSDVYAFDSGVTIQGYRKKDPATLAQKAADSSSK